MIQSKIGRNDPCPCGSGKKFKKCCLDKPSPELLADFELGERLVRKEDERQLEKSERNGELVKKLAIMGSAFMYYPR